MPGKSRNREKRLAAAKKMKIAAITTTTQVSESAPAITPAVTPVMSQNRTPSPASRPTGRTSQLLPSYVGPEIARIGIVSAIVFAVLVIAYFIIS